MFKNSKGFTLVEILIVVAIIGILASVVLVGIRPVQQRARDSRRVQDLKNIQSALEMYYQKNSAYPAENGWSGTLVEQGMTQIVPTDPTTGEDYNYKLYNTNQSYILKALLEAPGNAKELSAQAKAYGTKDATCGKADSDGREWYCVSL